MRRPQRVGGMRSAVATRELTTPLCARPRGVFPVVCGAHPDLPHRTVTVTIAEANRPQRTTTGRSVVCAAEVFSVEPMDSAIADAVKPGILIDGG